MPCAANASASSATDVAFCMMRWGGAIRQGMPCSVKRAYARCAPSPTKVMGRGSFRLVDAGEKIVLDFSEIKLFTTLFFNNALAKYVLEMGPEAYSHRFEVKNLSEVGETTYLHSMENAKDYYRVSAEEKELQQKLLADFDE